MKIYIVCGLTIFILLVTNIIFFRMLKMEKEVVTKLRPLSNEVIKNGLMKHVLFDGVLLKNITLYKKDYASLASEQVVTSIDQILTNNSVVVYFFNSFCTSCLLTEFRYLNDFFKKNEKIKIVIITNYVQKNFEVFLKSHNIYFDIYEMRDEKLGVCLDEEKEALLFVSDRLSIATSFVLNKDTKTYLNSFIENIKGRKSI